MTDFAMCPDCSRPALRYHGGKWLLAPWITGFFPDHRVYVEPYGGAASVLLRKVRSYAEVYNDLDGEVVNLFQVLRSPNAADLIAALRITPFARAEFEEAYLPAHDPLERARRLIIRSFMGFGSDGHNPKVRTGFRADSNKSGTTPAHDWANYPPALAVIVERLRGAVIENRPAVQVIAKHDGPQVLFYVDPPYLPDTRSSKSRKGGGKYHAYVHEMDAADHAELLAVLGQVEGMVVLSGYPSRMYDAALSGWSRHERKALADGARERTEVVWLNPACAVALQGDHGPLFAGGVDD